MVGPAMNFKELKNLIASGRIYEKNCEGKSQVWKKFVLLLAKETDTYTGYTKCVRCETILKHDRARSGTSHLQTHIDVCTTGQDQRASNKISNYFFAKKKLPNSSKENIIDAAVSFIVDDMRPLRALEGKGLLRLMSTCVEIGAKHGRVEIADFLPSRFTIKRKIIDKAKSVQDDLINSIKGAIVSYGLVGITTDMWSDLRSRHFISLTVHFVESVQLHSQVLSVTEFPDGKKTGSNIRICIENTTKTLGLPLRDLQGHCRFVTDQGSNVKSALSNINREACACHMLATVLRHTLQLDSLSKTVDPVAPESEDMHFVESIQSTVNAIKSLVTYLKKSGLSNKVSGGVPQCNDTRWNSTYLMLEKFKVSRNQVENLLEAEQQTRKLEDIDSSILDALLTFLKPFFEATKYLEGESYPTIHRVFQYSEKLKRHMVISPADCDVLKYLKKRGLVCLRSKFEISSFHMVSFFLNPKFKALVMLSPQARKKIHDDTTSLLALLPFQKDNCDISKKASAIDHNYTPPEKCSRSSIDDEFLEWQEEVIPDPTISNEVLDYVNYALTEEFVNAFEPSTDAGEFDVFKFWADSRITSRFPRLSRVACGVLSIPASGAPSERTGVFGFCFSACRSRTPNLKVSSDQDRIRSQNFSTPLQCIPTKDL